MTRKKAKSADQTSFGTPGTMETPGALRSPPVASGEPHSLLPSTPFQSSSGECRLKLSWPGSSRPLTFLPSAKRRGCFYRGDAMRRGVGVALSGAASDSEAPTLPFGAWVLARPRACRSLGRETENPVMPLGHGREVMAQSGRRLRRAKHERGGPGYLKRFSASISGVSAGVRLPCGLTAG